MRHFALTLALLGFAVSGLPARAQASNVGGLPCWGFCQLWMGGQDVAADPMPRPRSVSAGRRHRWTRSQPTWSYRDRREATEERDAEWLWRRPRLERRVRPLPPVVVATTPTMPTLVRRTNVPVMTPLIAVENPRPKAVPDVTPASSTPIASAPTGPATDISAVPLE